MSLDEKLKILGESARYEVAGPGDASAGKATPGLVPVGRDGRQMFKVLMDNTCRHNCAFCPAAANRDIPRASFAPDELARTYHDLHEAGDAHGLFLSSAVCGGADQTMERMLDAVRILREQHADDGYVHLKVMPGASDEAIRQAVTLADRVSVNLDTPNADRMACVEPTKDWDADVAGTLGRARRIADEVKEASGKAADVTTALVVGASGETDGEILKAVGRCYEEWKVRRVHFGRFQPVGGTSMECFDETPPVRVQRLYQTDFLVRRYGFDLDEFETHADGNLDPETDPKIAVARLHPDLFPVEVTTAPREMLLRVPGLGELSVRRILRARAEGGVRDAADLHAMGVVMRRAAPFLTVHGRMPSAPAAPVPARSRRTQGQLSLF